MALSGARTMVVVPSQGLVMPNPSANVKKTIVTPVKSSSSVIDKINASGVPITGGNSASSVNTTSVPAGITSKDLNLFGNGLISNVMNLLNQNTARNNAWSAEQAQKQMDFQTQSNQIAMDFNAAEAAKNRNWQQMMSNTAHQREIRDLKAAGLNPVLSATGGNGAAVTSGSAASGVTSSGAMGDTDTSMNTVLASLYGSLINAQTSMYNANLSARTNLQLAEMQTQAQLAGAQLAAEASKYAAGTNYAASVYASDQNLQNNREQRQWNTDHPSNWVQAGSSLFGNSGVSTAKENAKGLGSKILSWIFDR